jgi:parallel beta-helix repeat protein
MFEARKGTNLLKRRTRTGGAVLIVVVLTVATVALLLSTPAVSAAPSDSGIAMRGSHCSVTVHKENPTNDAVQDAINAYPGGTICISSGSFPEQVTISTSGTVLKGAGASKTILDPSALVLNTFDYDYAGGPSAMPAAAIVLVQGSSGDPTTGVSGVTIEDLEVNGVPGQSSSVFTSCSNEYFGVDFQASSGTLTKSTVTGIQLPPSLFGCQDGLAVYAYNGYFNYAGSENAPDTVTIAHSTITSYDKNGITCDDPYETCSISSNMIQGIGSTDLIAQNGIQVGFGALGSVASNDVSENGVYTGAGSCSGSAQGYNLNCTENEGAGILLYDTATGTSVTGNTVSLNDYGIDYFDDGSNSLWSPATTTISGNSVDSNLAYGIVAQGAPGAGDQVTISSNTVDVKSSEHSGSGIWGAPGILVDTGNFTISHNKIEGSSAANGASNGASQQVCGPAGSGNAYTCSPGVNINTAAIQATSESAGNPTYVTLTGNTYKQDVAKLATAAVLGGVVDVDEA